MSINGRSSFWPPVVLFFLKTFSFIEKNPIEPSSGRWGRTRSRCWRCCGCVWSLDTALAVLTEHLGWNVLASKFHSILKNVVMKFNELIHDMNQGKYNFHRNLYYLSYQHEADRTQRNLRSLFPQCQRFWSQPTCSDMWYLGRWQSSPITAKLSLM